MTMPKDYDESVNPNTPLSQHRAFKIALAVCVVIVLVGVAGFIW